MACSACALALMQRQPRQPQACSSLLLWGGPCSGVRQAGGCTRRNADTLKLLNDTEKKLKQQQTEAYINLDKAAEEREAGNKV